MSEPANQLTLHRRGRPPGFAGTANREIDYRCGVCHESLTRDTCFVKRAIFALAARGGKVIRSRTITWLCKTCMEKDEHFIIQKWDAPGMKGTSVAETDRTPQG